MKILILVSLVILTSCMAQRVSIVFEVYSPYCAGAKPTPEMAIGITKAFSNEKIAVFRREPDKTSVLVKWIELDSSGKWIGPLKPGNYDLFREDKILTINEIEKKYRKPDNELYVYVGEEKIKVWKETPDFTFEVKNEASVSITLREKCFVGLNPCMEYIGPKPR